MNNKVIISVIILSYFHEDYLGKALESVLNQKIDHEVEIIIADDCSADDTTIIAEKYKAHHPEVIHILKRTENVGTCRNLYEAMLECKGKYILIMAGDDTLCDAEKLKKQYVFLEDKNNSEYVAVCTPIKTVYTDGIDTGKVFGFLQQTGKEITISDFLNGYNYPDQGILIRNIFNDEKARRQFALLPEFSKYIEDLTLNFFLFDYGKIFLIPDITYALTVRREDDHNQHNYNSIRSQLEKVSDHLSLLNKINDYYHGKYNLQKRYSQYIASAIVISLKQRKPYCFKLLKDVPKKYIVPSCLDYFKLWRRRHK